MSKNINVVTFPEYIGFESVNSYIHLSKSDNYGNEIIFDLSNTLGMHSAFIGFLIHMKHILDAKSVKLTLITSPYVEHIFHQLNNLDEYFTNMDV